MTKISKELREKSPFLMARYIASITKNKKAKLLAILKSRNVNYDVEYRNKGRRGWYILIPECTQFLGRDYYNAEQLVRGKVMDFLVDN